MDSHGAGLSANEWPESRVAGGSDAGEADIGLQGSRGAGIQPISVRYARTAGIGVESRVAGHSHAGQPAFR